MHGSHDSSEIEAREKGVTRKRDARDAERPAETRIERQQRQDEATNFASHDSSEIEAREKGVARRRDVKDAGRPAETRIERQRRQDEATNFAELPTDCDWGCKRNSKGRVEKRPSDTASAPAWSACSGCSRTRTAAARSGCAGTRRCSST